MKDEYHRMYISINSLDSMHFQTSLAETFNQTQAWAPGFDTTEFNLRLIRPEDFTSHSLQFAKKHLVVRHAATCYFAKEWLLSCHSIMMMVVLLESSLLSTEELRGSHRANHRAH